jgi:hypothetical protein
VLILLDHGNPVIASGIEMDSGETLWRIKGEAYVCGIMHGEAFRRDITDDGMEVSYRFQFEPKSKS